MNKINPTWIGIALTFIIAVMGGTFAYGQATNEIEDNTTAIISISEDVDENSDDIVDIQIVLAQQVEMIALMKEYLQKIDD